MTKRQRKLQRVRQLLDEAKASRQDAYNKFKLGRDLDAGVKNGIYLAYFFGLWDSFDPFYDALMAKQITRQMMNACETQHEWMLEQHARARRAVVEQMNAYLKEAI